MANENEFEFEKCTELWHCDRAYSVEDGDYRVAKFWYCPQCYSWFKTKREAVAHLDAASMSIQALEGGR